MEKILRKKFILVSVSVVFAVCLVMSIVINLFNFYSMNNRASNISTIIIENNGVFPPPHITQDNNLMKEPFKTRYFTIKTDKTSKIIDINTNNIFLIDNKKALDLKEYVFSKNKTSSYFENFKYEISNTSYGYLIVFIDCEQEFKIFYSSLISSILICVITLLLVFILMFFLSKTAVRPIIESYNKQQEFITNITHELKTPLAIIKTNTEVIEMENSVSNWSKSIHKQVSRLNELISYLLSLSKLDEKKIDEKIDFCISDLALDLCAEIRNKNIINDIQKNLNFHGDEKSIRILFSIILENAVKYSSSENIYFCLKKRKNKIAFYIENEALDLEQKNYSILFERFYRLDSSRNSQTGGFGIGLAMAKSIVENHGGKISAESTNSKTLKVFGEF